ncbi:MAG: type II CRISPR-associated endonuclease Cas1 [Chthonomonadales bacterium]|nr:type II CRISPR-associated endonuclease Cas1 [Chthonomonadales bacterium]
MSGRIVEVSSPAALSYHDRQLVVARAGEPEARVPLDDLGVLVLDYAQATATVPLLAACAAGNVAVVVCDGRHMPAGLLAPFAANTLHARTLREQIAVGEPRRKRLWQAVVVAKIGEQSRLLRDLLGDDGRVGGLAPFVRSGDPDNVEARAARIYFERLFGEMFVRDRAAAGLNAMLNYGYAVVRAAVARAVVGAGLHPALGIHHHNQYDAFSLADDLMEPLRPLVDARAHAYGREHEPPEELTPQAKRAMLGALGEEVSFDGKRYPMMAALELYAARVRACLLGEGRKLACPGR